MIRDRLELAARENGVTVHFVTRVMLAPFFGRCYRATRTIWIREDLPEAAQRFLYWHELHHLSDTPGEGFFEVEWEATFSGIFHYFRGALAVLWLSVSSWERWKLYASLIGEALKKRRKQ